MTFESFGSAQAAGRIPASQISANIAFVATGTFRTLDYVDRATESFDTSPEPVAIRFVATFPATVATPRIVLLQHDFGGWRHDLFPLADQLAGAGVATLRIDAPYHGDRAICRVNADCSAGGTCESSSGRCSTALLRDADGKPLASGRGFAFGRGRMSTKELFNIRDLMRQATVDLLAAADGGAAGVGGDPGVCGGQVEVYVEPILPKPTLVVIGAGHVGKAVAYLAGWVGFLVVVNDDRPGFCTPEVVPGADEYLPVPMAQLPEKLEINPWTYLVLTTRGMNVDVEGLPELLKTQPAYIGLIGSKRRWQSTRKKLIELGMTIETLDRVRSPIGLELKAGTPEEIAVSIMGEIIMIRNGGDGLSMSN